MEDKKDMMYEVPSLEELKLVNLVKGAEGEPFKSSEDNNEEDEEAD
ncbi:MAG: hypothetical protein MJ202_00470 [Lentisphaeria bacterium]|nr:hypothetical protein [Lentisphaeria bacterium]